jgi:hypothetical protein
MILQQFHVLSITLSPSINPELANYMRKVLHYLVIGKDFFKRIHKYLGVITDDATFELRGKTKQIQCNVLEVV